MRIAGARSEQIRPGARSGGRPDTRQGTVAATGAPAPPDRIQVLGIPPAEMTARLTEAEGRADRDALPPLYNRRAFVRELSRVRTFGDRYGFAASLVYFDLDGFKSINDRLGHAAGDQALKAVADILLSNVREGDVVGRMGGDEFAVVLDQADRAAAAAKAAALCEAIAADPALAAMGGLRASYGVAGIAAGADPEAILAEADGAMYETRRLRKAG